MNTTIAVAGATGNLGGRIVKVLLEKGAHVRTIVRNNTDDNDKIEKLKQQGVEVIKADMNNKTELTSALKGVSMVISALQGLEDVIIDTQFTLLEAAVAAGVSRFMPSDYSVDYTKLSEGENRNFDLRHEFYKRIDKAPIEATSIFNGAFADILAYSAPFIDLKNKSIGYWDNPDWKIDVTTMDDTAAYIADVAMDKSTPRKLLIAGFQISPKELKQLAEDVFDTPFNLTNLGSVADLAAKNKKERAAYPEGEKEVYANWQGSQYLHSMFSAHHDHLDNDSYPDLKWTGAKEVMSAIKI
jgi:NAD(P)-dependent dehydrogenase (short-subunit alcohol dehydrogenase family)